MNRKQRRAGRTHGTGPFGRGRSDSPADQLFELGQAHHDQGRLTEAETIFRRALQLDPKHSGCLNRLGILAHQCGHPDAAVTLIGQAIATNGDVAEYHYNIALVLAGLGRMDEAVAHNRRAVAIAPGYADAHTNLGGALAALGHWSEAALHFRRALARRADSPVAYHNLSVALLADGKLEEALQVLARGLAVTETNELKQNFAREVVKLRSAPKIPGFMTLLTRAATEGWSRPEEFFSLFMTLLKQDRFVASVHHANDAFARPCIEDQCAVGPRPRGARRQQASALHDGIGSDLRRSAGAPADERAEGLARSRRFTGGR
jgi:Flp pilus assembly protein TadD